MAMSDKEAAALKAELNNVENVDDTRLADWQARQQPAAPADPNAAIQGAPGVIPASQAGKYDAHLAAIAPDAGWQAMNAAKNLKAEEAAQATPEPDRRMSCGMW